MTYIILLASVLRLADIFHHHHHSYFTHREYDLLWFLDMPSFFCDHWTGLQQICPNYSSHLHVWFSSLWVEWTVWPSTLIMKGLAVIGLAVPYPGHPGQKYFSQESGFENQQKRRSWPFQILFHLNFQLCCHQHFKKTNIVLIGQVS